MKKSEIKEKLVELVKHIDRNSFVYDFLSCFGLSKTTIARLRKGDYNLSKVDGELFYKGKNILQGRGIGKTYSYD